MINIYKGKAKYIFSGFVPLLLLLLTAWGGNPVAGNPNFHISLTFDTLPPSPIKKALGKKTTVKRAVVRDTLPPVMPTLLAKTDSAVTKGRAVDTTIRPVTVVDTFNIKYSKDALDAPIEYHADDSMVLDVPGKKILLYGKENKATYQDNELVAPAIVYDQKTNMVMAHLQKDSLGNVVSYAKFKQSDFSSDSDSLKFNLKTGKGQTKGTYFMQNEMFVYANVSKKVDSNTIYAQKVRFTTCNLDTPHFAFVSNQVKFINQKMAFTGPVHPEFEGVPIPVVLPFGIYPLRQGRHSGILAPAFTANEQLGLALEGLGYYKVLNDNWDVTTRGTIYSYGGWMANVSPRYFKRYRYQGSFSLDMQRFKTGLKGDPDFRVNRTFAIRWQHNSDNKARPGVTFSANVDAGSSSFNQLVPNSPGRNFTNQLQSSITYTKAWKNMNISIGANHNQNTQQRLINLNLPDIAFNLNTIYPFRRKEAVGELRWYENLGVALNSNAKSLTSFIDTLGDIGGQLSKNFQWGVQHTVPITLSLPQLGPLQIAPNVSYSERWFQQKMIRSWNSTAKKVDTAFNRGFFTARDVSFGFGITTRIFGMFAFGKNSKVQAIRHEIRPSIGLSYKPDFNGQFFYNTQIDSLQNFGRFNVFDGSVNGAFGEGRFGGINFSIDNNIQMKVRNRKDTGENAIKKVTLIDGFSISGNYNLVADSFAFSTFSMSARTNLFDKINITASATTDPYQVNSRGERIDTLIWRKRPFSLGRLIGGNVSIQSQFRGGSNNDNNQGQQRDLSQYQQQYDPRTGQPLDDYQQEAAYIRNNPGEFADFSVPWSFNFSYSLRFQRERKPDYSGFQTLFFQDVTWGGDVNITPKWKIGMNGTYNFTTKELGTISMFLTREMHCWQMSINASPVGRFRFFNFTISPKSGLLRDLRINRTRYFFDF
jgi:LPS-assembly protein